MVCKPAGKTLAATPAAALRHPQRSDAASGTAARQTQQTVAPAEWLLRWRAAEVVSRRGSGRRRGCAPAHPSHSRALQPHSGAARAPAQRRGRGCGRGRGRGRAGEGAVGSPPAAAAVRGRGAAAGGRRAARPAAGGPGRAAERAPRLGGGGGGAARSRRGRRHHRVRRRLERRALRMSAASAQSSHTRARALSRRATTPATLAPLTHSPPRPPTTHRARLQPPAVRLERVARGRHEGCMQLAQGVAQRPLGAAARRGRHRRRPAAGVHQQQELDPCGGDVAVDEQRVGGAEEAEERVCGLLLPRPRNEEGQAGARACQPARVSR